MALISESWFLPSRNFNIPHFNLIRSDRQDGYGGVSIATHISLQIRRIEINPDLKQVFSNNKIDVVDIEVLNIKDLSPITFWSCYIPGDSHIPSELWNSLFQLGTNNFLLCGDFNAHRPAWGSSFSSRRGNMIHDIINSQGISVLNSGAATHLGIPNCPNYAIAISFCSPNLIWSSTWSTTSNPHGSDHFPIIISLTSNGHTGINYPNNLNSFTPYNPTPSLQFNLNKADWNSFSELINQNITSIDYNFCPIEAYNKFIRIILDAAK